MTPSPASSWAAWKTSTAGGSRWTDRPAQRQRVRADLAGGSGWAPPAGWALQRGPPPPVPGGGSRLSREKARTQRVAGGGPPRTPFSQWPARWHSLVFGGCATLSRWWGCYEAQVRALIWKLYFTQKMLSSRFSPEKCVPKSVFSGPQEIAPRPYQRQPTPNPASWERAAIKAGGPGGFAPGPLSPFLGRNGDPAGVGGVPGALCPKTGKSPDHL